MTTTTLELPSTLRFTIGEQPRPVIEETRLSRITARQRAGQFQDGIAAIAGAGLAIVFALGLAGL